MVKTRNIYLMYAIALLQGMVFYSSVATLYRQAAGVSIFQITVIESVSLLLTVALELPWGIVADKIGYRGTMIICSILYFVSKLIFWRAEGFAGFLLERVVLSVVIAGLSGVDASVLYLSCPEEKAQFVFGVYENLGTVGLMAASAVFSLFVGENYRMAGFLTVLTYGAAAVLSLGLQEVKGTPPEKETGGHAFLEEVRQLPKHKDIFLFLIGVALLEQTHQTITVFLNQPQYLRSGMTSAEIGVVYIGMTLCGLLGMLSEKATAALGRKTLLRLLFVVPMTACVFLGLFYHAALSVLSILAIRVCFSLMQPLKMTIQNEMVETENRATALSIQSLVMDGVAIATNLIFGRLADTQLRCAMLTGALFCGVGLLMVCLWQEKTVAGNRLGQ